MPRRKKTLVSNKTPQPNRFNRTDKIHLFYQPGNPERHKQSWIDQTQRLRIIFDNGTSAWFSLRGGYCIYGPEEGLNDHCYVSSKTRILAPNMKDCASTFRTFDAAIKAMRKFDQKKGFPPAEYLGFL